MSGEDKDGMLAKARGHQAPAVEALCVVSGSSASDKEYQCRPSERVSRLAGLCTSRPGLG